MWYFCKGTFYSQRLKPPAAIRVGFWRVPNRWSRLVCPLARFRLRLQKALQLLRYRFIPHKTRPLRYEKRNHCWSSMEGNSAGVGQSAKVCKALRLASSRKVNGHYNSMLDAKWPLPSGVGLGWKKRSAPLCPPIKQCGTDFKL